MLITYAIVARYNRFSDPAIGLAFATTLLRSPLMCRRVRYFDLPCQAAHPCGYLSYQLLSIKAFNVVCIVVLELSIAKPNRKSDPQSLHRCPDRSVKSRAKDDLCGALSRKRATRQAVFWFAITGRCGRYAFCSIPPRLLRFQLGIWGTLDDKALVSGRRGEGGEPWLCHVQTLHRSCSALAVPLLQ